MKNLKQENNIKGITLIALVITIIVLLILAAVSIATLTGENGILTKANDASETSKDAEEDERVKLAVATALSDNLGEGLTTDTLKEAIGKEFGEDKKGNLEGEENGPWTFKGERKTYTIETTGKIASTNSTTPPTEKKLAKEVLQINQSATEDYKKSPYVKYNEKLCRVLYNDESHGLQIVTADNIDTVNLGKNDESVEAEDFSYDTSSVEDEIQNLDDDFKKAAASYNNALDKLNNKAKEYLLESDKMGLTSNKIAIDARCLGSESTPDGEAFQVGDTTETNYKNEYQYFSTFNNKFKPSYEKHEEDVKQVKNLGLGVDSETWLASRYLNANGNAIWFSVSYLDYRGYALSNILCDIHSSSSVRDVRE